MFFNVILPCSSSCYWRVGLPTRRFIPIPSFLIFMTMYRKLPVSIHRRVKTKIFRKISFYNLTVTHIFPVVQDILSIPFSAYKTSWSQSIYYNHAMIIIFTTNWLPIKMFHVHSTFSDYETISTISDAIKCVELFVCRKP